MSGTGRAWIALATLLATGSVLAWWLPSAWLDWQPGLAASQPWRLWGAAFVHWSPLHLGGNLLATGVVGFFGWAAALPWRAALAWALAWPLTHLALVWQPALAHYGGLSGVLHAGVAVAAAWLLLAPGGGSRPRWWSGRWRSGRPGLRRAVGAVVGAGLLIKLWREEPWGLPLRHGAGWDIAVAPWAHASGAAAGLLCLLLVLASSRAAVSTPRAQYRAPHER